MKDRDVLRIAVEQDRFLVTFDKDFGDLVFSARTMTKGVVLLRFAPTSPEQVAQKLKSLLDAGVKLENNFVVLGEERIRITPIKKQAAVFFAPRISVLVGCELIVGFRGERFEAGRVLR